MQRKIFTKSIDDHWKFCRSGDPNLPNLLLPIWVDIRDISLKPTNVTLLFSNVFVKHSTLSIAVPDHQTTLTFLAYHVTKWHSPPLQILAVTAATTRRIRLLPKCPPAALVYLTPPLDTSHLHCPPQGNATETLLLHKSTQCYDRHEKPA